MWTCITCFWKHTNTQSFHKRTLSQGVGVKFEKQQTHCSWSSLTPAGTNQLGASHVDAWSQRHATRQRSILHVSVRLDSLTCPFKIRQPFRKSTTSTERVHSSTPSRLVPYIRAAVASDVQVIGMAWRGRTDLNKFFFGGGGGGGILNLLFPSSSVRVYEKCINCGRRRRCEEQ